MRCGIRNALVMRTAAISVAQKQDRERRTHQQHIFHRVVLGLAAITIGLLSSVLGAHNASLGAVMGKRGEDVVTVPGVSVTGSGASVTGVATVAEASATVTPSRCARAVRERAGVAPRVRRATCRAGNHTSIHWLALPWLMPNKRP